MPRGEAFSSSSSSSSSPSSRLPRKAVAKDAAVQPNPLVSSVLSQHPPPPPRPPKEARLTGTSIVARCLSLALRRDKLRNRIIPGGRRWRGWSERGRRRFER